MLYLLMNFLLEVDDDVRRGSKIWLRKWTPPSSLFIVLGALSLIHMDSRPHIFDPHLTSSSTSSRTPPIGRRQRKKLGHQFWWSTLPSVYETSTISQISGFEEWISFYLCFTNVLISNSRNHLDPELHLGLYISLCFSPPPVPSTGD